MSAAYSSRLARDERLALGLVLDLLDLVEEDGVDRRLGPHHGDRSAGQGNAAVGLERRPGHRVQAGAVGLADDHRDLRHRRLGDRADHLRAVADDPLALDRGADHEPGHVGEKEQRDVERVAGHDEASRLVGGVDEQDAALLARLVGDDPDRPPVEPRVADHQLLRPAGVDLAERARVDERVDQVLDVERGLLVVRDDLRRTALGIGIGRRRRRAASRASSPACRTGSAARARSPPRRS